MGEMKKNDVGRSLRIGFWACLLIAVTTAVTVSAPPLRAQPSSWPESVRIVYLPVFGKDATIARFAPVTECLQKSLGRPVTPVSFDSYDDMVVHLAKGDFEIAYLSPATYIQASSLTGLEVVAMELDAEGKRGYYSVIICRSDKKFQSLQDVRGSVLAFTDPASTSGFLVPLAHFIQDLGQTPESFAKKVVFAGDHSSLVKGVHEGLYDAGATGNVDLARTLQAENIAADSLKVLWSSDLIPGPPVCVRPDLPPSFKAAVLGALVFFSRDSEGTASLQIGGFGPASQDDYKLIKRLEALKP